MLLRIGLRNPSGNVMFRMLDVVSFRRPAGEADFFGFDRFRRFQNQTLAQLSPNDEYVNEQVVAMYLATCAESHHCLLDCTAQRVSTHVDHNMQTHFEAVLVRLMRQPESMPHGLVAIFVHGGHSTFDGMLGLRFCSRHHARTHGNPHLERMRDHMLFCANAEPDSELRLRLQQAANGLLHDEQFLRDASRSCDGRGHHSVHAFLPLLQHLEGRAQREAGREPEIRDAPGRRSPLSTQHLKLVLFMMRHVFPELPIVVIGHTMVRRCLSVVAIDLLQTELEPLVAVTHMIVHSGGNGADLAQQFLRPSTTLTAFHRRHRINAVEMLASELVWDVVSAMQAFTEWQQFDPARNPLASRQDLLRGIEDRIHEAEAEGEMVNLMSPLVQALGLNEEQRGQLSNAFGEFEDNNLDPHALLVAFVISQQLNVPRDADGHSRFRSLFSQIRQPLAGAGAGRMERDLGDALCILSDISSGRNPHHFRQVFAAGRRRVLAHDGPSELGRVILEVLRDNNILGTADAPAHEYPHPRHPRTESEIRAVVNRARPELHQEARYSNALNRSGGLGLHLHSLLGAQTPWVARRNSSRGTRGRQPYEYWMIEGRPLPQPPPQPPQPPALVRLPTFNESSFSPSDYFSEVEASPGEQCLICLRRVPPLQLTGGNAPTSPAPADDGEEVQWFAFHEPRPAGSMPHIMCSDCTVRVVANRTATCPSCREPLHVRRPLPTINSAPVVASAAAANGGGAPLLLAAPQPPQAPVQPPQAPVVSGWPVQGVQLEGVPAPLPDSHLVAARQFSFFYCPVIFAALGFLDPDEQGEWEALINGSLVIGHPQFDEDLRARLRANLNFNYLLDQVRYALHLLFPLFVQNTQVQPLQANGMLADADALAIYTAINQPYPDGRPYVVHWRQRMILDPDPTAQLELGEYANAILEQVDEHYQDTLSPAVFGPFLMAAGAR